MYTLIALQEVREFLFAIYPRLLMEISFTSSGLIMLHNIFVTSSRSAAFKQFKNSVAGTNLIDVPSKLKAFSTESKTDSLGSRFDKFTCFITIDVSN